MGMIMHKELEIVSLVELPSRKPVPVTAYRAGDVTVLKVNDRDFAICRGMNDVKKWAFPASFERWPWQRELIFALMRLGILSKSIGEKLFDQIDANDKEQRIRHDRKHIDTVLAAYGVKLTAAQKRKIK